MQTTPISQQKPNNGRYNLAKAWERILARVFDSLFLTLLIVGVSLILIYTNPITQSIYDLEQWRYFVIGAISFVLMFIYFLIIPFVTKGRTLGLLILKLKIYNLIPTKNFFLNLLKREFFLWIIMGISNLCLGIALFVLPKDEIEQFIKLLLLQQQDEISNGNQELRILATLFQALWTIAGGLLLVVIIHMCVFNKRRCFIDNVSDTVVIKLIDVSSSDASGSGNLKRTKSKRNYGLPGEIIAGAEDEINSL